MSGPAMTGDAAMRLFSAGLPVPEFETTAFVPLDKRLSESKVAIVTTAVLHRLDQDRYTPGDTTFRAFDRSDRDLVLGH